MDRNKNMSSASTFSFHLLMHSPRRYERKSISKEAVSPLWHVLMFSDLQTKKNSAANGTSNSWSTTEKQTVSKSQWSMSAILFFSSSFDQRRPKKLICSLNFSCFELLGPKAAWLFSSPLGLAEPSLLLAELFAFKTI